MPGIEHPPSTSGSPRHARRAVLTGLALLSAVALAATAAAGAGDPGIESVDAVASSTNTSFLDGQLQLVRARANAEATAYEAQAAAATPVVVEVPTTVPPPTTTTAAPAPPTTAAPAPAPAPAPAAASSGYGDPNDPASWDRLAQCEAGGNWAANTGNGYYGGLQFSLSSWQAVGGAGYPHENSRETQIEMGRRLYAQGGWSHWPGCARKLGYI
jgi:hypothetical protein